MSDQPRASSALGARPAGMVITELPLTVSETPTLYEWAGGRAPIARMINCFYDRVERDELLSPFFPGGVREQHREHVATWWCEVLGGPAA